MQDKDKFGPHNVSDSRQLPEESPQGTPPIRPEFLRENS